MTESWVEYRIEQLGLQGWFMVASRIGTDSKEMREEVEQARCDMASRSLRYHRVRRFAADSPEFCRMGTVAADE